MAKTAAARKGRDDEQDEGREELLEASRQSKTAHEATLRQDAIKPRVLSALNYPTWIFCDDGRSQIVADERELEAVQAGGGTWDTTPFPAGSQFLPSGTRTFAAPVGTIDARGAAARVDQPTPEVALTTALPRNEMASVPSADAETRQRHDQAGAKGRRDLDPGGRLRAELEGKIQKLQDENRELRGRLNKPTQLPANKNRDRGRAKPPTAEQLPAEGDAERQSQIEQETAAIERAGDEADRRGRGESAEQLPARRRDRSGASKKR